MSSREPMSMGLWRREAAGSEAHCCDSSKNKHVDEAGHLIARSKGLGKEWLWCYLDDAFVRGEVS